jgi:hypothetical protein
MYYIQRGIIMEASARVDFIIDDKGKKKSVVMSYKHYSKLMEDLSDLAVKKEREKEEKISYEDVLKGLKESGKI